MRDIKREREIIRVLLHDVLEAGSWASPETKEYIREHMIGKVYTDWLPLDAPWQGE